MEKWACECLYCREASVYEQEPVLKFAADRTFEGVWRTSLDDNRLVGSNSLVHFLETIIILLGSILVMEL